MRRKINSFTPGQIRVTDRLWEEKVLINAQFLDAVDPDRVLAGFRITAGIDTDAKPYGGWENSLIAGHGVGHFFSALAFRLASLRTSDMLFSDSVSKAKAIIGGLRECQEKIGSGFLSAATVQDINNPEIQFDALEGKLTAKTWVPWYALHKVLQGLIDLWEIAGLDEAKEVALNLGDWICDRVRTWDEKTQKRVVAFEYGGMNDSLYRLFQLTGDKKYRTAAGSFDEPELYEELIGKKDGLKNVHANATIPKVLGYLQGAGNDTEYASLSNDAADRISIAERFWKKIVANQMYATGGMGDMEHFFADGALDTSRTQCNAESCCVHNMMKLSRLLFILTGKVEYIEYNERALWNARLGSLGPNGGYTYFNPMATGYYRLYSPALPDENPFWCCVGTGMEDFVRFSEQLFFEEEGNLVVAQWLSSDIETKNGVTVSLRVDFEEGNLVVKCTAHESVKDNVRIRLRIPRWIENREKILPTALDYLDFELSDGEEYRLDFTMKFRVIGLDDDDSVVGFMYGPFVLAVPLGNEKWGETVGAGIEVIAPKWKSLFGTSVRSDIVYGQTRRSILDSEYLKVPEDESVDSFKENIMKYVEKHGGEQFCLRGLRNQKGEKIKLELRPYYGMGNERYGVYWYLEK